MGKMIFTKQNQSQLELSWKDEDTLRSELEFHLNMQLEMTLTNNSSSILSLRRQGKDLKPCLRMHHMFLSAEPVVIAAIAEWIKHPKGKKQGLIIERFIQDNRHLIQTKIQRRTVLRTQGQWYDLQAIYDEINSSYFEGKVHVAITWGRASSPSRQRSIRFGSYYEQLNLIRIHPVLDQEFVPAYVVRSIVFHEMLHAYIGVHASASGRRRIHPPEFKRLEQTFPDYSSALAWQSEPSNLRRLLKGRRSS